MKGARAASISDRLLATLEELGVDRVFGLPGTQNIDFYESLRRSGVRAVLTTSEIAAGFMATGWYRASGRPGVFAAIEGPGFAWSVPPLTEAALDASALILITGKSSGNVQRYDLGSIRQDLIAQATGATNYNLENAATVRATVLDAWSEATERGPGPVVFQLGAENEVREPPGAGRPETRASAASGDVQALADVISAFRSAERPVFFIGSGCIDFADDLRLLIDEAGIPCVTSPGARGVIDESHALSLAKDLLFTDVERLNAFFDRSDLVVVLGSRLARNSTSGFRLRLQQEKLAYVGPHGGSRTTMYPAQWNIQSGIGEFLKAARTPVGESKEAGRAGWDRGEIEEWRNSIRSRQPPLPSRPVWHGIGDCTDLYREIRNGVPADGIVVTDTGLHQLLTRAYFEVKAPRGLIFPTDFQSMGFGLPAAIGAAMARRDKRVVAIIGDGSLLMVGAELLTARREKLGLPVLVFCDKKLGLIHDQQVQAYGRDIATQLQQTTLSEYAAWLGVEHTVANSGLADQIRLAFERDTPTIIEVRLDEDPALRKTGRKVRWRSMVRSTLESGIVGRIRGGGR